MSNEHVMDLSRLGAVEIQDARLQRVKRVILQLSVLVRLLQLDGSMVVKAEGWPKGAGVIGSRFIQGVNAEGKQVPAIELLIYRPDFPIVLDLPEQVRITISGVPLVEAQAEAVAAKAEETENA